MDSKSSMNLKHKKHKEDYTKACHNPIAQNQGQREKNLKSSQGSRGILQKEKNDSIFLIM